jgi:hypothetical protein
MSRFAPDLGLDLSPFVDSAASIATSIAQAETARRNAQAAASNAKAAAANAAAGSGGTRRVPPIAYAAAAVAIGGLVWMFVRGRRGRGRRR